MSSAVEGVAALGNLTNFPYLMWYLMTAPPFILPTKPSVPEVQAVSGQKAGLPCNISNAYSNDTMTLLSWYKDDSQVPVYTVDSRRAPLSQAKHFPSAHLGTRGFFDVSSHPFTLFLDPVMRSDEGLYRCQIEFKRSPTVRSVLHVQVIVFPKELTITDENGRVLNGTVGPIAEGSNLTVTCRASGGTPPAIVSWWLESMLVDNSFTLMDDGSVTNELTLPNLQRINFGSTYTCLASNTNFSVPLSSSVTVDMDLKPMIVAITTPPLPMESAQAAVIHCETWGSRPKAIITWRLGNETLHATNESFVDNCTSSSLLLTPKASDDGAKLACLAEHPTIPNSTIQDEKRIVVIC